MCEDYDFDKDDKWNQYIQSADKSMYYNQYNKIKGEIGIFKIDLVQRKCEQNVLNRQQQNNEHQRGIYYIYSTENMFKMSFMLLLFMQGVAQIFGYLFIFSIVKTIRHTQIQQKRYYIKPLINNEFFYNLVMHNILIYSPILMHSWIEISEFLFLHHKSIYERMQTYIDKTKQNKELFLIQQQKWKLFYYLSFYLQNSYSTLVFGQFLYLVFLKLNHKNKRSKVAWIQIDYFIESKLPRFIVSAYREFRLIAVHFFVE